jgi:predicted molibdopterin-dependent oxidoreductase YjgC
MGAAGHASRRLAHGVVRPAPVAIELDGEQLEAYPGESLAAAMLAAGRRAFRATRSGAPRGPLCNMGVCFDCVVLVEGLGEARACMTAVHEGLRVHTGLQGDGAG